MPWLCSTGERLEVIADSLPYGSLSPAQTAAPDPRQDPECTYPISSARLRLARCGAELAGCNPAPRVACRAAAGLAVAAAAFVFAIMVVFAAGCAAARLLRPAGLWRIRVCVATP